MVEDQDKLAEEWAKALAQEEEGGAEPDEAALADPPGAGRG